MGCQLFSYRINNHNFNNRNSPITCESHEETVAETTLSKAIYFCPLGQLFPIVTSARARVGYCVIL
jgi:hypothetical protein